MLVSAVPAALVLVAGLAMLLASWVIHWILMIAGAAVLAIGVYLVLGGPLLGP